MTTACPRLPEFICAGIIKFKIAVGAEYLMGRSKPYKITIIAPTCFYYQAPLFRALASDARLDLTVYFCSDEGISGKDVKVVYGNDKGWGVEEELLKGYHFKFLRN